MACIALLPNELLMLILRHLDPVALASMLQSAVHMRRLAVNCVRFRVVSALQQVTTQHVHPDVACSATLSLLTEGVLNAALRAAARTGDGVVIHCLLRCATHRHMRVKMGALVQISRCSGHVQLSHWLRLRLPGLSES